MIIKKLKWVRTIFWEFTRNGKPVSAETWKADTGVFGTYLSEQTIGGKCFVETPSYRQEAGTDRKHLSGYRRECKSVEDGKQIAEKHWENIVLEVFTE